MLTLGRPLLRLSMPELLAFMKLPHNIKTKASPLEPQQP